MNTPNIGKVSRPDHTPTEPFSPTPIACPSLQPESGDESVCKPDPVPACAGGDHPSGCTVAGHLERSTRRLGRAALERLRNRTPGSAAFDLAPGGVYRAAPVTRGAGALLPHRFTLTGAPPSERLGAGGLFSVALSRGSPRVAVNNRPALRSPDFPRRQAAAQPCPFLSTRPPDRLVRRSLCRPGPGGRTRTPDHRLSPLLNGIGGGTGTATPGNLGASHGPPDRRTGQGSRSALDLATSYGISPWSVSRWGSRREANSVQRGSIALTVRRSRGRW